MNSFVYLKSDRLGSCPTDKGNPFSLPASFERGNLNGLTMEEIWKDIPGYEGIYQASTNGRIRSYNKIRLGYSYKKKQWVDRLYKGKIIKPSVMNVYLGVVLTSLGIKKTESVHRLVAKTFIENPYDKKYVNHIDFDVMNNAVSNLEWCTAWENIHHTMKHNRNRSPKGEQNGHSKIMDIQVNNIFEMSKHGYTQLEIARKYNMDQSAISRILNKKTYKHLHY